MPLICFSMSLLRLISHVSLLPNHGHLHLLLDEFQATVDRHDCLYLVLLQQHWADLLVDVRIVVEDVEFLRFRQSARIHPNRSPPAYLLDRAVLLLL
jgi:hypothetical protein